MCISPLTLDNGQQVACRECWQCIENKIKDWAGRCIAEGKTAVAAHAIGLTYGRGKLGEKLHERAVVLTYSDFQKFLKLLRRHGYPVRYLVAGELGGRFSRAHWHAIIFWQEKVPPFVGVHNETGQWVQDGREQRIHWHRVDKNGDPVYVRDKVTGERKPAMWWPHGHVFIEPVHQNSAFYACKYVHKDAHDQEAQKHLSVSKKPPLAAVFFAQLAEQYVRQGLAPQTLAYRFPEVRNRDGKVIEFMLKARSAELYLEHYVSAWEQAYPGRPTPPSDLVDNWVNYRRTHLPEGLAEEMAVLRNEVGRAKNVMRRVEGEADAWWAAYMAEQAASDAILIREIEDGQEQFQRQEAERQRAEAERAAAYEKTDGWRKERRAGPWNDPYHKKPRR